MGHLSDRHWLYRVWQKLNQWTLQRASTVFTLSEGMAKELVMDLPLGSITRQKVEIIPPWSNSQVIYPVPPEVNRFMIEAGLTDTFVVLYAGNMGLTHPLETLIEAARHLQTCPHIQILMVGDGPKRLALQQQAEGLENLKFLPFLPDPDFNQCLSAASVVVVALQAEAAAASVPSKTYNALAAGKPLLVMAAAEAEISRLVDRYDVGLRV
jgi:glycosyltransferase involved in cell wall biosynthesis